MKKVTLLILIIGYCVSSSFAQAPYWQKAMSAGTNKFEMATCIDYASDGNYYVGGYLQGDSIQLGQATIYNPKPGKFTSFLVKFSSINHEPIWFKVFHTINKGNRAHDIVVDKDDNIIITGRFDGAYLYIDTDTLYRGVASNNTYLAKFNPSGKLLWSQEAVNNSICVPTKLAVDHYNNVYLTGIFGNYDLQFGTITTQGQGLYYTYLVKFSSAGNAKWIKKTSSYVNSPAYYDNRASICLDNDANIYLAGGFDNAVLSLDSFTVNNSLTGEDDIFISKIDSFGEVQWLYSIQGNGSELIGNIVYSPSNEIILGGKYNSSLTFQTLSLPVKGSTDIFVSSWSTSGNVLWVNGTHTSEEDRLMDLTVDASGNIYSFGATEADSIVIDNVAYTDSGSFIGDNLLIQKWDNVGQHQWTVFEGHNGTNAPYQIALNSKNNIISLAGFHISYGWAVGNDILSSNGGYDIFIGHLLDPSIITSTTNDVPDFNTVVYPNPVNKYNPWLFLSSENTISNVFVYNMSGSLLLSKNVEHKTAQINLSSFPQGMYIVRATSSNGNQTSLIEVVH